MEAEVETAEKSHTEESEVLTQTQTDPDAAKEDANGPDVCKFFLMGRCHFGDRCRLSHSGKAASGASNNVPREEKRSRNQKSDKTENAKGSKKKPRMRTADEVISRILWDSSVDPADFMVGHLDRFLGVLERPFCDFSWDTQVCDCDYSEEMAIPRHRIQYFTYKGQRVWDRDSRTDHVFGSTGQTVMPPFDRECQPQENVAPDAADQEAGDSSVEKDEQEDTVELSVKATGEDIEDTARQMDCSTRGEPVHQSADAGLEQETDGLSISPRNEQAGIEDEWKDSWDRVEEEEKKLEPAQPLPQEPRPGRVPRKPTHFICFRVDLPASLNAFQRVQKKVLSHLPQLEPFWVTPETLHVTLCLLVLQSPEEVFAAGELLHSVVRNRYKPPISVFFPPKLKHFNGRVLHIPPQPLPDIQTFNGPFQEAFREKGWLHRHSLHPNYHLTLAKVTEEGAERMFEDVGLIRLAKDVNFGKLEVDKLYMCTLNKPRTVSGFYETVCVVNLPTV
ncbi:leukocyte receptor cluster member 9 [Trichomycterus rosablanca]|uniref:leukocyte receptor cluster member 9 n=1 Tax=Trichomycterus rosablanca TaxID=2290929 RepID=UPI002F3549A6